MSELDEIMEGKHEIKHLHIEGDTIAFETELNSHAWNLSPRDIEIIIYCLQKENNKQKEILDKIKERVNKVDFEMGDFPELELAGDILELLEEIE